MLYIDYFINLNKTLMSLVSLLLLFSYGLGQSGKVISPRSYVKESRDWILGCITPKLMVLPNILYILLSAIYIAQIVMSLSMLLLLGIVSSLGDLLFHCGRVRSWIIYLHQNIVVSSSCSTSLDTLFSDSDGYPKCNYYQAMNTVLQTAVF